jgi:hypothetical protein
MVAGVGAALTRKSAGFKRRQYPRLDQLDTCSSLLHRPFMAIATAATAPRRIDRRLLALAESSGVLFHRSGTEQLEHWATLGAAVETVLGLPTVAKFKTLGQAPNIDSLIAQAGTPGANRKLAQFLEKQVFPQYGVAPGGSEKIVAYVKRPGKSSGRRNSIALAVKGIGR